jgi:hypothetical protein
MTGPPAQPAHVTVPAVHRTPAKGHVVQLRSWDGHDLMRRVSSERAELLVDAGLAIWRGQHLRLKLGIRWIPDLDFSNCPPDLMSFFAQLHEHYYS